jgi:hypothetical protein
MLTMLKGKLLLLERVTVIGPIELPTGSLPKDRFGRRSGRAIGWK